jgi:glucokinase
MTVSIGVDLGGTNIKAGVVDSDGKLLYQASVPTAMPRSAAEICGDIVGLSRNLLHKAGFSENQVSGLGIGCPGTVNPNTGIVMYAPNLPFRNVAMQSYAADSFSHAFPVHIENDANAAALGEFYAGSAKGAGSVVVITIGTGLGVGAIIHSKMLNGHFYGGGEFGHMVIERGGKLCGCGRRGCFEAYASATGLINLTRDELARSPESLMRGISESDGKVSAKTAFLAMKQGDEAGARVVDLFISYLACGVTNIINALQPEVLSIGGGVSGEGDYLLIPLREKVLSEVYGGPELPATDIRICTLGNDAGIIGAAMLERLQTGSR